MDRLALAMILRAHLNKSFASGFTLDVRNEFGPGVHILFGASGAGKTTAIDCLAGLTAPDAGLIALDDLVLFDRSRSVDVPAHQRRAGYVFQSHALFPHLSARENVAFGTRDLSAADRLLADLDLAELTQRKPGQLSAGQAQRVALARALAPHPKFLLMDEPLGALDVKTKAHVVEYLRGWNKRNRIPILYVTHDRDEAYALGERVLVMEEGKIIADGSAQKVLAAPQRTAVAQLAGFENLLECEIVSEHADQGTMSCRIVGTEVLIEASLVKVRNAAVTLGIRAGDILIASERPRAISARNVLLGTVESMEQRSALVRLLVNVKGAKFEAHITPAAQVALGIGGGKSIWLVIKTFSCHLLSA